MQPIEMQDLVELDNVLKWMLEESPKMRRKLHEELAAAAKLEVNRVIASSGLNDSHGTIRRWQVKHVGSGGGYAAVRPENEQEGGGKNYRNSAAAITSYLESGHRTRGKGNGPRRKTRLKMAAVNGFHFYRAAREPLAAKALVIASKFVEQLGDMLEGTR